MLIYIGIYLFIALATFISVIHEYTLNELIACAITSAAWPLYFAVRLIRKLR
jgi:hypothetical protein